MGLHPVRILDVGVQLCDRVLVHYVGHVELLEVQVGQLDWALRDIHANSNFTNN